MKAQQRLSHPLSPKNQQSQRNLKKCLKEEVSSFGIYDSTVKDECKTIKAIKDRQARRWIPHWASDHSLQILGHYARCFSVSV